MRDYYSYAQASSPEWAEWVMAISVVALSVLSIILFFKIWRAADNLKSITDDLAAIKKQLCDIKKEEEPLKNDWLKSASKEVQKKLHYGVYDSPKTDRPTTAVVVAVIAIIAYAVASVATML